MDARSQAAAHPSRRGATRDARGDAWIERRGDRGGAFVGRHRQRAARYSALQRGRGAELRSGCGAARTPRERRDARWRPALDGVRLGIRTTGVGEGALLLSQARRDRRGSRHGLGVRELGRLAGGHPCAAATIDDRSPGRSRGQAVPPRACRRRRGTHLRLGTGDRAGTRHRQPLTTQPPATRCYNLLRRRGQHPATLVRCWHHHRALSPPMPARTLGLLIACVTSLVASATLAAAPAPTLSFDDARHLLNRAGFGASASEIERYAGMSREQAARQLLDGARTAAVTPPPAWTTAAEALAYPRGAHAAGRAGSALRR